jgi:hypothetical protein
MVSYPVAGPISNPYYDLLAMIGKRRCNGLRILECGFLQASCRSAFVAHLVGSSADLALTAGELVFLAVVDEGIIGLKAAMGTIRSSWHYDGCSSSHATACAHRPKHSHVLR